MVSKWRQTEISHEFRSLTQSQFQIKLNFTAFMLWCFNENSPRCLKRVDAEKLTKQPKYYEFHFSHFLLWSLQWSWSWSSWTRSSLWSGEKAAQVFSLHFAWKIQSYIFQYSKHWPYLLAAKMDCDGSKFIYFTFQGFWVKIRFKHCLRLLFRTDSFNCLLYLGGIPWENHQLNDWPSNNHNHRIG